MSNPLNESLPPNNYPFTFFDMERMVYEDLFPAARREDVKLALRTAFDLWPEAMKRRQTILIPGVGRLRPLYSRAGFGNLFNDPHPGILRYHFDISPKLAHAIPHHATGQSKYRAHVRIFLKRKYGDPINWPPKYDWAK